MIVEFPIGDWSGDGHELFDTFHVEVTGYRDLPEDEILSNLREAHFDLVKIGIDIGEYCQEYEQHWLLRKEIDAIISAGFDYDSVRSTLEDRDDPTGVEMDPNKMIYLWVSLLNWANPKLGLMIKPKPDYHSIVFFGYDDKNRHLRSPGYGLFFR